jgi:hypothetical protein
LRDAKLNLEGIRSEIRGGGFSFLQPPISIAGDDHHQRNDTVAI